MEMSMMPRLEQRMKMAPQIIQSIEILQLSILALQARIEQEQLENPVLEMDETPKLDAVQEAPVNEMTAAEQKEAKDDFSRVEDVKDDFQGYFSQTISRPRSTGEKDAKLEAIQNTPGPLPSLRDYLMDQIRFLDLTRRRRDVCEAIVNNLNRAGRLCAPLDEIAMSLDDPPSMEEAEAALRVVQSLDPPGVGARDLRECLLLQIDPNDPDCDLEKEIILNHLPDIRANRYPKIAKATGREIEDVKRAVGMVCMLHPAPGRLYDNEVVPRVVPEVHVELLDGRYDVRLDDSTLPHLRVSPQYSEMLSEQQKGSDARGFLQKKMESARWLIGAIQQRRRTILKVSREIVKAQTSFFDNGISQLRPLKMQEVADAIGMHVATVSRAIRHKYMQTPHGLFLMKYFFTGGTRAADGEMEAWDVVKRRIKEITDNEDKSNPLSDDEIMKELATRGTKIARRTVTKYRKALTIPSSRQRKSY